MGCTPAPNAIPRPKRGKKMSSSSEYITKTNVYKYKAMDTTGREVKGKVTANSEKDAAYDIKCKGLFPILIKKVVNEKDYFDIYGAPQKTFGQKCAIKVDKFFRKLAPMFENFVISLGPRCEKFKKGFVKFWVDVKEGW